MYIIAILNAFPRIQGPAPKNMSVLWYIYIHIYIMDVNKMNVYINIKLYLYIYVYIKIYINLYIHTYGWYSYMPRFVYINVYVYIYNCIYIYTYMYTILQIPLYTLVQENNGQKICRPASVLCGCSCDTSCDSCSFTYNCSFEGFLFSLPPHKV